jgi:hypothetical protein
MRKHKLVCQHQPGSSSRSRVAMPSVGPVCHPAQPMFQLKLLVVGPNNSQTPATRNQNV